MKAPTLVLFLWLLLATAMLAAAPDPLAAARDLYTDRKWPEAKAAFEKIAAAEPQNAEAAFYLGRLALRGGENETAIRWLEKATTLAPTESAYFRELGDAYGSGAEKGGVFSKISLAKKALAAWDKAVALNPDDLDARYNRVQFYRSAPALIGGGMKKAYAEAAEIRQRDALRGALILGDLYIAEKNFSEAFALFDETIAKFPRQKTLLFQVGRLAAVSGQQLDRGEAALKNYLGTKPPRGGPSFAAAHWQLGNIYEKKGDKIAARASYEEVLKLDPKFTEARESLKKLK